MTRPIHPLVRWGVIAALWVIGFVMSRWSGVSTLKTVVLGIVLPLLVIGWVRLVEHIGMRRRRNRD